MAAFEEPLKKLDYVIHNYSSFSSAYVPENIQEDKLNDQSSRWSSATTNTPQFLTLKLYNYAIVKKIMFGKYEKTHVCNLKKFKVYGGMTEDCKVVLLESGLKNDCTPETFELLHKVGDGNFACRYIKIMPLQSWGTSFNFSIWYVELHGIEDWSYVKPAIKWFNTYREREVVRLCLKYFRQHNYEEAFGSLQRQTQVQLEGPLLSNLHDVLVCCGDYEEAENIMEQSIKSGLQNQYIAKQEYQPKWQLMETLEETETHPEMRGGHQMCLDSYAESIYLFGGWDGHQDLNDLWVYHIPGQKWTLVTKDSEAEGGPSPRSCHKLCLDPERRQIFVLGRYLDMHRRTPDNLKSDFYMYDIESNRWTLITEDTAAMGGPQLIFDHQMSMDTELRTIYVFGGRVLTPLQETASDPDGCIQLVGSSEPIFSSLYSYHVPTNTWTKLCDDCIRQGSAGVPAIRSRVGHSMLFHPGYRKLYIFSGQRNKDYLNDFFTYNVDTREVVQISGVIRQESCNLPAAGFTQRATIDPDRNEIYVLSGLNKEKDKKDNSNQNSFWVYSIHEDKWACVYRNENTSDQYWIKMKNIEPCPRFAHQLVYDQVSKIHYLFGGNPGKASAPKMRLNDFWQLQLCRPTHEQLLRKCKLLIRKSRFEELALKNKMVALEYLQTTLCDIVNHDDAEETKQFQLLASALFRGQEGLIPTEDEEEEIYCHNTRSHLFDQLVAFFPESMTQPKGNLIDLIPVSF